MDCMNYQLELMVTRVVEASYVDLNDFSGFRVPGKVVLKTTSPIPVSELPNAGLEQYGHEYASGTARIHPREARRLLGGRDAKPGDIIMVNATVCHRNNGMRKGGFFFCSDLRRIQTTSNGS